MSRNNSDRLLLAVRKYESLVTKALKLADPSDVVAVQRLGAGLSALAKAHTVLAKDKGSEKHAYEPLD